MEGWREGTEGPWEGAEGLWDGTGKRWDWTEKSIALTQNRMGHTLKTMGWTAERCHPGEGQMDQTDEEERRLRRRIEGTGGPGGRLRRRPLACHRSCRVRRGAATLQQLRLQQHRTPPPPRPPPNDAMTSRSQQHIAAYRVAPLRSRSTSPTLRHPVCGCGCTRFAGCQLAPGRRTSPTAGRLPASCFAAVHHPARCLPLANA